MVGSALPSEDERRVRQRTGRALAGYRHDRKLLGYRRSTQYLRTVSAFSRRFPPACRSRLIHRVLATLLVTGALRARVAAQTNAVFEQVIPPGANFDKAEFRLWVPADPGALHGVVVLMPGSNGDGRSQVSDTVWQQFATRNRLALVGVHLNDKPHDQNFIEDYVVAAHGSGQERCSTPWRRLGQRRKRPELATAPLLLLGDVGGWRVQL